MRNAGPLPAPARDTSLDPFSGLIAGALLGNLFGLCLVINLLQNRVQGLALPGEYREAGLPAIFKNSAANSHTRTSLFILAALDAALGV